MVTGPINIMQQGIGRTPVSLALLQRHRLQKATVAVYQDCFAVLTVLCVAVIPFVLFLRR